MKRRPMPRERAIWTCHLCAEDFVSRELREKHRASCVVAERLRAELREKHDTAETPPALLSPWRGEGREK